MRNGTTGSYVTTIRVDRAPADAYAAITDVRGWWSQDVDGPTDEVGGEFDYHFQDAHRCRIRVTELVPGRRVAWHIVDNHFDFVQNQEEWTGTDVVFDITATDSGSEVRFTHVGLLPEHECFDVCSNAWSGYITGSLRNLINTGTGQPNPKEDGTLPTHQDAANAHRTAQTNSPRLRLR